MKTLKKLPILPLLLLSLAWGVVIPTVVPLALTGCSSTQVAAGSEAWVVESEKDLRSAFYVVDEFLRWEHANRATAGADVTKLADTLRREFPGKHASAEAVLRTYKRTRTPEARADASTWVATVNAAMIEALRHLPPAEATKAFNAAGTK